MSDPDHRSRVPVGSQHIVQFFDDDPSLAAAVSSFLIDGVRANDALLVVMSGERWNTVVRGLEHAGLAAVELMTTGQLVLLDAAVTLGRLMRCRRPNPLLFTQTIGETVRSLRASGRRLRVYGEMVDLLAAEAEFRSAHLLEEMWNDLARDETFTLLCGYSAVHFGNPRNAEALRSICSAHSEIRTTERDPLGAFLLDAYAGELRPGRPTTH